MNILIPHSWLLEYLQTNATPQDIQRCLSLCGQSAERLKQVGNDWVYDIEVTTNRVDCMSVIGIAREAAAILPQFGFTAKLKSDPFKSPKLHLSDEVSYLNVSVDQKLCTNFAAVLISNVTLKPSPQDIVNKLELVGLRPLNNVVDVSNLLMHELGQPIHTFDYDKIIDNKMILRTANKSEIVTTLDNQTHTLSGGEIVIEDGSGNLIDLCGIMGGLNSSVDSNTKNVLLFVQTYNANLIRKTSMSTGLRTQAAIIFEKQLPEESVLPTLFIASKLIKQLAKGTISNDVLHIGPTPSSKTLSLAKSLTPFTNTRLGVTLSSKEVAEILKNLGFKITSDKNVYIPWYRKYDINIPEDLVEEVARIYGYHNLPSNLMTTAIPTDRPQDYVFKWEHKIKQALKYWGFTETYTYSLIPNGNGLKLKNPLSSEWVYLRTNLTESHLEIISQNLGRISQLNFFEISKVYLPQENNLPKEDIHLIISTTNSNHRSLKGVVEALSTELGTHLPVHIVKHTNPECFTFECNLTHILKSANSIKKFVPISKFAPVIEDVNIVFTGEYAALEQKIYNLSPLITKVDLLDVYQDKLTLQITYHSSDKQLSKDDVAPIRSQLEVFSN